jgi:hypothetical protein
MLLDTLGRIQSQTSATPETSQESIVNGEEISSGRQSIRSTAPGQKVTWWMGACREDLGHQTMPLMSILSNL